jgi:hypothetical protein
MRMTSKSNYQGFASLGMELYRDSVSLIHRGTLRAIPAGPVRLIDDTGGFGSSWIDNLRRLGRKPIGIPFSGHTADPRYDNKRTESISRRSTGSAKAAPCRPARRARSWSRRSAGRPTASAATGCRWSQRTR